MNGVEIRAVKAGDETLVLELLRELAVYEKIEHKFHLTPQLIARDFIGENPLCGCDLLFADGRPAGVMTWYRTYASFAAARGIFLEDIFVRPAFRGKGLGKAFFVHLAARAKKEGATHIQWHVLDWNAPSIAFYEGLGATHDKEWLRYNLNGDAIARLAGA
ncbi:MAG TPA: GNAT family N-acetyltransferase [Rhizomicrobium sp.]|nr:GNAT family N-acetyltransferase [Rhizomicrobium sp.]